MKGEHIFIIVLLFVIIVLLVWIIVNFYTVQLTVTHTPNLNYNKANAFIQDLCTQINENIYVVLFDKRSRVETNTIYVTANTEKEIYEEIIELLAQELHKKTAKDKQAIKKTLEQIAYNLGYLVCTVNCNKS